MDVAKIALDAEKAGELYRAYREHKHYSTPIDDEIRSAYRAISKGKLVIQAIESVKAAGLNAEGFPKLAIGRATEKTCVLRTAADGSCTMSGSSWDRRWGGSKGRQDDRLSFPKGSFPFPTTKRHWGKTGDFTLETKHGQAQMPIIPLHLRPKQALDQYHVLFEAEWTPIPPVDPYLLRRIGQADLWIVCAMWDLSPVERAALATRVSVQ